jgi:hypothetical protein
MLLYSFGELITLQLILQNSSGVQYSGASPVVAIRRPVDNCYYDFSDGVFKLTDWVIREIEMPEVQGDACSGIYEVNIVAGSPLRVGLSYSIEYDPRLVGYPRVFQLLRIIPASTPGQYGNILRQIMPGMIGS